MAKRRRYHSKMTLPIAPIAGLASGFIVPIQQIAYGDYAGALRSTIINYTGWNTSGQNWDGQALKNGLVPLLAGLAVHATIGRMVNPLLARAKVPFLRL